jgi:hypothetical protein
MEQNKEQQYIQSLNEIERQSYELAKKHLKGIFYLEENNGFLEWKKKNQQQQTHQSVNKP